MKKGKAIWIRTPDEFCVKTTDPGKPLDIVMALKVWVTREKISTLSRRAYFANGVTGSTHPLAKSTGQKR